MLRLRILTALVLIPVFLGALFYLPPAGFAWVLGVMIAIGAWEWGGLAGLDRSGRILYAGAITLGGAALAVALLAEGGNNWVRWPLGLAFAFWLSALHAMVFDGGAGQRGQGLYGTLAGKLASGFLVLVPAGFAGLYLLVIDPQRPRLLLFAFVLVWVADTAAYFAGHQWGRHKLAPTVSPGKTIEGVLGAIVAVLVMALAAGTWIWPWQGAMLAAWAGLAMITTLFSVLGDLVESKFKRLAGVKDSGTILPGHGGVLDRIDALTAALPIFAFGWFYFRRLVT